MAFDRSGSSSQKFINSFASPANSKKPRVGIGKNMSDLTGGKGQTSRTRKVLSNFGILDKVQSNLSNKSGNKNLDGTNCKFSFTGMDFQRPIKIEKYKLDKLLGKESNKSAIFLTNQGQHSGSIICNLGQNCKDKSLIVSRCGRNGRGNSPQPQIELLRKGGYGSYTSSTLQTVSMINPEPFSTGKWVTSSSQHLCQTKFIGYECEGNVYSLVHFEESYDPCEFLNQIASPRVDENVEIIHRLLRGYQITESNESKFFLPKASIISVEGGSSIDICHERMNKNYEVIESDKKDLSTVSKINDSPEEFNYGEPGYALGLLDTPSFTAACKSDEFTFGRGESKDDGMGPQKPPTESVVSSMNYEFDKQDTFSDMGQNCKESSMRSRKINTQRDYSETNQTPALDLSLPLSERYEMASESRTGVKINKAITIEDGFVTQTFRIEGLETLKLGDRSFTQGNQEYQDSAEDSERYNLYKNIYVSDSEDCDYDVPRSEIMSESENSSQKGKIYGRIDEGIELDSGQLFLDEELRTKYQSLLQNN